MRQVERSLQALSWTSLEAFKHVVQDPSPNSSSEEKKEEEEMQSEAFSEVQSKALRELWEGD